MIRDLLSGIIGFALVYGVIYVAVAAYCTANPYHYRVDEPASRWEHVA